MTTKLILVVIGLTAVSAILVPTYAVPTIRSADIFDGEVKTADLANGAVTNSKLATDAVTTSKIKNGEVTSDDIKDATIQEQDIADGVIPDGGGTVTLNVHEVRGEVLTLDLRGSGVAFADCPDGEILTGGGFETDYPIHVATSAQRSNGDNAWVVEGANEGSIPLTMQAFAYCLDPTIP